MPKKPAFDNPIRILRETHDLTQARFAAMLGISVSFLQKLELGKNREISPVLAVLMMIQFGARPESLTPKIGRPRALLQGTPGELKEQLDRSVKLLQNINSDALAIFNEHLVHKLAVLVEAASVHKRGIALLAHLDIWIDEQAEVFQLWSTMKRISAERGVTWGPYLTADRLKDGTIEMGFAATDNVQPPVLEATQESHR
jgi:transcriptional regulator with XRE-family HTH domain